MTQQVIDIGAAPDDGTGDPLRLSFDKCNQNFTELYNSDAGKQPLDADLTAIAALTGTDTIYYRSGNVSWNPVTFSGLTFSGGVLTASASGAPINSPTFTGDPKAPTPATADNDTSIATTAFVKAQGYLVSTDLASYAPLASPALTGNPTAPTPTAGDNDTSIATTAFVQNAVAGSQPLDADLTAIAALTGTNTIYYRSAANTWSPVVVSTGLVFSGGILTATAATKDAFCANRGGADVTGFTSTPTKCPFHIEVFDQNSKYDNASNFRWTPAAGLVLINAQIFMTGLTAGSSVNVFIYKNGASYRQSAYGPQPDGGTTATAAVTLIDSANGTDYYECWASTVSAAGGIMNGLAILSFFQGTQL